MAVNVQNAENYAMSNITGIYVKENVLSAEKRAMYNTDGIMGVNV